MLPRSFDHRTMAEIFPIPITWNDPHKYHIIAPPSYPTHPVSQVARPTIIPFPNSFPSELTDIIINQLDPTDTKSLKAVALVCRDFVAASRSLLFSTITLTPTTTQQFYILTRSPHCTLTNRIQRLELGIPCWRFNRPSVEDLSKTVLTLTNLTSLRVSSYFLESIPLDCPLSSLTAAWPLLASVELLGIQFGSLGDTIAFICAFPALEKLILLGVTWRRHTRPPDGVSLPKRLHTLRLMSGSEDILEWMLSLTSPPPSSTAPPISTLTLDDVTIRQAHLIYDFISAVASTLHRLSIYFKRDEAAAEVLLCNHPHLNCVPELRVMRYSGMSMVRM